MTDERTTETTADRLARGLGGDPATPAGAAPHDAGPGRATPVAHVAATDRYDRMTRLAELFDRVAAEMRDRSRLGAEILRDDDVSASASLSPRTWEVAEAEILRATSGRHGLSAGSAELDADALVVRATVLTYRWIDELAETATRTLGSVAGRAIGYLAPEVELGGAVVAAGLIETDTEDREGLAAYLGELAEAHPDLMDHVSTAGGLLDGLQLRSLLTPGLLRAESPSESAAAASAAAGLLATGVAAFGADAAGAVRDVAGDFVAQDDASPTATDGPVLDHALPSGLGDLMTALAGAAAGIEVHRAGPRRLIAYLPGREDSDRSRLRLVGGDHATYAAEAGHVVDAAATAVGASPEEPVAVMLVGGGAGGVAAAELAARTAGRDGASAVVDAVVTVGSPSAQAPRVPGDVRVLSLEDSADPVALLGSLITAGDSHRTSIVFDGGGAVGPAAWVAGGTAADAATHEGLRDELGRLRALGYLA